MNRWLKSANDPKANGVAADSIIQFKKTRLPDLTFNYRSNNPNWSCAGMDSKSLALRMSVFKAPNMQINSSLSVLPIKLKEALAYKVQKTEHRMIGSQPVDVRVVRAPEDETCVLVIASAYFEKPEKHADFILIEPTDYAQPLNIKNCKKFLDDVQELK
jgi:hypothetical protein